MRPCSFPNAIKEPLNEIPPINTPTNARVVATGDMECAVLAALNNSIAPINAAEPPPIPLYKATICGISVIATFLPLIHARTVALARAEIIKT